VCLQISPSTNLDLQLLYKLLVTSHQRLQAQSNIIWDNSDWWLTFKGHKQRKKHFSRRCKKWRVMLQQMLFCMTYLYSSITSKGLWHGQKWALVCRFWSLSWTNGPNTQFKWKLRYSPIQCAHLEPLTMYFQTVGAPELASSWCLHWFLGLRADVWQMRLQVYTRLAVTQ